MKNFRWWSVVVMVATAALLSACGGGDDSSNGSVSLRLVNATQTHGSLDLLVNSGAAITGTATDTASAYVAPASGVVTLQLNDTGSTTAVSTLLPTLTAGQHYTLVAYESASAVKMVLLNESYAAPAAGSASLHLYDAATEAGKLDVYVTDPTVDLANVSSPTTSFTGSNSLLALSVAPGTYRVRVTAYGNKNDLRADIGAVTLTNQQIGTVVLTPASGGVLLNGAFLIQQGTYTASRNTNTRVRLAAAVSGGATVAATASGGAIVIDPGSVSPSFGLYKLVPSGSAGTLNITVNSASVAAPAGTLPPGGDVTLLVSGTPSSATATLITDDNRAPTDTTTVKLRFLNGITGSTGSVLLTANTVPVGGPVAPGSASSYVTTTGSTSGMNLTLTSSAVAGVLYSNSSNILNPGSVYTVMAGGDISAPQLLIR